MTAAASRRLGHHSLERIERNTHGAKGYLVYAGDLGHSLGYYPTLQDAKDALDIWHYLHPEEQRQRDKAWMSQFLDFIGTAADEDGLPGVYQAIEHYRNRFLADGDQP